MSSALKTVQNRLSAVASSLLGGPGSPERQFPAFDDLPNIERGPQGCIWDISEKDGKKDEVWTINLLTPTLVQAASREIQSREQVRLGGPLHNVQFLGFNRKEFSQTKFDLVPPLGFKAMDDEFDINTQSGSQRDSLKRFARQATGK